MEAAQPDARDVVEAARRVGWYVGIPLYDLERRRWQQYAYDTTEKDHTGQRTRHWTADGRTEEECIADMARRLREISR